MSQKFEVKEGLRQGHPLSPILFNIMLEKVVRKANINGSNLLYVPDNVWVLLTSLRYYLEIPKNCVAKTKYINWSD